MVKVRLCCFMRLNAGYRNLFTDNTTCEMVADGCYSKTKIHTFKILFFEPYNPKIHSLISAPLQSSTFPIFIPYTNF